MSTSKKKEKGKEKDTSSDNRRKNLTSITKKPLELVELPFLLKVFSSFDDALNYSNSKNFIPVSPALYRILPDLSLINKDKVVQKSLRWRHGNSYAFLFEKDRKLFYERFYDRACTLLPLEDRIISKLKSSIENVKTVEKLKEYIPRLQSETELNGLDNSLSSSDIRPGRITQIDPGPESEDFEFGIPTDFKLTDNIAVPVLSDIGGPDRTLLIKNILSNQTTASLITRWRIPGNAPVDSLIDIENDVIPKLIWDQGSSFWCLDIVEYIKSKDIAVVLIRGLVPSSTPIQIPSNNSYPLHKWAILQQPIIWLSLIGAKLWDDATMSLTKWPLLIRSPSPNDTLKIDEAKKQYSESKIKDINMAVESMLNDYKYIEREPDQNLLSKINDLEKQATEYKNQIKKEVAIKDLAKDAAIEQQKISAKLNELWQASRARTAFFKGEYDQIQESLNLMTRERDELQIKLQACEDRFQKKLDNINDSTKTFKSKIKELEKRIAELERERDEFSVLKEKIKLNNEDRAALAKRISEIRNDPDEFNRLQSDLKDKNMESLALENELNSKAKESREINIQLALLTAFKLMEQQWNSLLIANTQVTRQLQYQDGVIGDLKGSISKLEKEKTNCQDEIKRLKDDLETERNKSKGTEQEVQLELTNKENRINELQALLADKDIEIDDLKRKLNEADAKQTFTNNTNNDLKKQILQLEGLVKKYADSERGRLAFDVTMATTITNLQNNLKETQEQLKECKSINESTEVDLREKNVQVQSLLGDINDYSEKVSNLQAQLSKSFNKSDNLLGLSDKLNQQIAILSKQNQELEQRLLMTQGTLEDNQALVITKENKITELMNQINKYLEDITAQQYIIKEYKSRYNKYYIDLGKLTMIPTPMEMCTPVYHGKNTLQSRLSGNEWRAIASHPIELFDNDKDIRTFNLQQKDVTYSDNKESFIRFIRAHPNDFEPFKNIPAGLKEDSAEFESWKLEALGRFNNIVFKDSPSNRNALDINFVAYGTMPIFGTDGRNFVPVSISARDSQYKDMVLNVLPKLPASVRDAIRELDGYKNFKKEGFGVWRAVNGNNSRSGNQVGDTVWPCIALWSDARNLNIEPSEFVRTRTWSNKRNMFIDSELAYIPNPGYIIINNTNIFGAGGILVYDIKESIVKNNDFESARVRLTGNINNCHVELQVTQRNNEATLYRIESLCILAPLLTDIEVNK